MYDYPFQCAEDHATVYILHKIVYLYCLETIVLEWCSKVNCGCDGKRIAAVGEPVRCPIR